MVGVCESAFTTSLMGDDPDFLTSPDLTAAPLSSEYSEYLCRRIKSSFAIYLSLEEERRSTDQILRRALFRLSPFVRLSPAGAEIEEVINNVRAIYRAAHSVGSSRPLLLQRLRRNELRLEQRIASVCRHKPGLLALGSFCDPARNTQLSAVRTTRSRMEGIFQRDTGELLAILELFSE